MATGGGRRDHGSGRDWGFRRSGCDDVLPYAVAGLAASIEASTPYNIAAGGTDFSDVFSGTSGTYWSATNGPNFESAQSYIPESPGMTVAPAPWSLRRLDRASPAARAQRILYLCGATARRSEHRSIHRISFPCGKRGASTVSAGRLADGGRGNSPRGRAVPGISMFAAGGYAWGEDADHLRLSSLGLPPAPLAIFHP